MVHGFTGTSGIRIQQAGLGDVTRGWVCRTVLLFSFVLGRDCHLPNKRLLVYGFHPGTYMPCPSPR